MKGQIVTAEVENNMLNFQGGVEESEEEELTQTRQLYSSLHDCVQAAK
jgi:hypothetical protein